MSDPSLGPLDDELRALLAKEARAYEEDGALHARVRRGVELAIGLRGGEGGGPAEGGAGHDPAPGSIARSFGAKALVGAALASFVAGGAAVGVVAVAASDAPGASTWAEPRGRARGEWVAAPSRATSDAGPAASVPGSPGDAGAVRSGAPSSSAANPSAEPRPQSDLRRERELIDAARAALASGRSAESLALLEQHARSHPRGQLGEEREALRVQSLVAAGRRGEAEESARRFRRAYPGSALLPIVEQAVGRREPP